MSLFEKFIYTVVVFLGVYVVLSLALRLFEITNSYNSHMIGGLVGGLISIGLFMYLLIRKK